MSKPTPVPGLGPRTPVASAARAIIAARLGDVLRYTTPRDPDGVHDMRVASRRLRAALGVFDFTGQLARAERGTKRLQDALGEVRDRQVQLEWLVAQPAAAAIASAILVELPACEVRLARRVERFAGRTAPLLLRRASRLKDTVPLARSNVGARLQRRLSALSSRIEAFEQEPDAIRAHDVRRTLKKLRYEIELIRPAGPRAVDALVEILRPFQDLLGELHDRDVRLDILARHELDQGGSPELAKLRRDVAKERSALGTRTTAEVQRWHDQGVLAALQERLAQIVPLTT